MEGFEFDATGNILLCTSLIELVERDIGILLAVDRVTEVEGNIVHQERFELFLQPDNTLLRLHVHIQRAKLGFFAGVDVWHQLQRLHVNRYADPAAHYFVDALLLVQFCARHANLGQVYVEAGLQLLTVELEVGTLRELVELFDKQHSVVFRSSHEQVIISKSHQTIQITILVNLHPFNLRLHFVLPEELECLLLQSSIVETTENIRDTESLRNALGLLELLLVERHVVILGYIL